MAGVRNSPIMDPAILNPAILILSLSKDGLEIGNCWTLVLRQAQDEGIGGAPGPRA
jgi:hypothetical protein